MLLSSRARRDCYFFYATLIQSHAPYVWLANFSGGSYKPDQSLIRLSAASRSSGPLPMRDFQNFKILRSFSKIAVGSCPCKGISNHHFFNVSAVSSFGHLCVRALLLLFSLVFKIGLISPFFSPYPPWSVFQTFF